MLRFSFRCKDNFWFFLICCELMNEVFICSLIMRSIAKVRCALRGVVNSHLDQKRQSLLPFYTSICRYLLPAAALPKFQPKFDAMHPPRVASNPTSAAAVSSRKRPTAPSIMSSLSGQSALSASSNYSYSSSTSSSSGSVAPVKQLGIFRLHENNISQQRETPQLVDITGTVDVQQQAVIQQQQLLGNLLSALVVPQQHQQQQQYTTSPQMMIALIEATKGLSGGASPFVGTLPGIPPPHPPPYNQSATPPMLQKTLVDKCSTASTNCIRDGQMPRGPMSNNNHNNTTTNANQHILRPPPPPATTAFGNNVSGHNSAGQLLASFGLPVYGPYELLPRLLSALQQSPPAAIPTQGQFGCHFAPQLHLNNANGTKQSPQLNQQLCQHQSQKSNDIPPTSAGINRQINSNITDGSSNFGNTGAIGKGSSPLEKSSKSSKRRSSCQNQGSACTPLGNSPPQQSPSNNVNSSVKTLRGEVQRTDESVRGREERNAEGKKKWGGNGTEARDARVATSGAQRPVPRKTRRLSVDCSADVPSSSTGRAGALSSSPKDESLDMAPSASSASSSLARTKAFSQQSLNDIMPAAIDSQNVSPSSSQSSDSPTGTNASPMEQDGEMSTADSFQCLWQQCGEVFIKEKPFVDHVNEHVRGEQSPSFFCRWDTCKRREPFNAQYMLAQHVRKHSGEKPYQCEFLFPDGTRCKKSYSRLENKKTHERTHNGERPYQCAVCNRSFTNASDKAKHQNRTHKKTKDYHCPVMGCIKQYTDPSSLRKHVFHEHGEEVWHFAKQSKEEKGSKTYGVNLIGIREDGTPYLIPQAQMPLSSSDEDREVDVMSTTPPPGSHSSRVLRASSHGEDRRGEQQQQRMTGQWLELNSSSQNGRAVTGPAGQQQSLMMRQPKQENVASPMQNAGNNAIAEQTMLSSSTTRLQQLKMDRGAADYQTQQVQYVSGTDQTGQQQQQQMFAFAQRQPANVARPMPQQQQQQHRSVVQSIGSHKHDFPPPIHAPASVVHVGPPHHRPQFFGPSHHNSPNPVLNNGTSPPAIFDFQTQQFRELDLMNSPEDPMPSNESGGYDGGNEVGAYGRMPVNYHSHHLRLPGGHVAYANSEGCVAAAVHDVAVHNHQHYGYQQHCQCKEYLVECQPSPPTGRCMAPPYPPPPPPAAGVNQSNVLHYSMCAYGNNKCDMTTSGCCQQTEAVQQQQRLYDSSLSLPQQQHYDGSDHGQQMLIHQQQQQAQQYHQHHQTQALHPGGTITGPENAGSLQQLLHAHPNQNPAQRVVAPPSAPLSVGLLEDIELDEVSSTLSDLKMSGGGDGGGAS
uniref:C2H2-type domain-containing protein n=1 Tax=Globodera rostochiensis TaxID=31243 RepID=A0A914I9U3_GLORO